ncbi:hypothetical protein PoB_004857400 [Plakobranchus ocellatus]|uniref:Uncharacterized protein n=1 Tax=Plakobranchus ocellatus TaxID=259542 RepID=A0AAV4BPN3_9GAST|nr:hypothetical protein PoB_004857400 [Plakobranchus ocellatus]
MKMKTLLTGCVSSHFSIVINAPNVLLYSMDLTSSSNKLNHLDEEKIPSVEELPLNPVYNMTLPIFEATKSDFRELYNKLESIMLVMPTFHVQIHQEMMHHNLQLMPLTWSGADSMNKNGSRKWTFAVIVCLRFGLQRIFMLN